MARNLKYICFEKNLKGKITVNLFKKKKKKTPTTPLWGGGNIPHS